MVPTGGKPPIDKVGVKRSCRDAIAALKKLGGCPTRRGFLFFARRALPQLWLVRGKRFFLPDSYGLSLRRTALHRIMVERAAAVGVDLLWQSVVTGISGDEVRVGDGNIRGLVDYRSRWR